jgi:hypothetical protein
MMMDCVTICSSRGRPKQLARMLDSFYKTKGENTKIWVYVAEDDPKIGEYRTVLADTPHEIGPHRFMCHVLNYAALQRFPERTYYHEANDDHVFRTQGWDEEMKQAIRRNGGWGIVSGKTDNLPTAIMVSGNIVRALGYWFPPEFQHHSCDLFVDELGKATNTLLSVPGVYIEHMHAVWGKAEQDDNYQWVYSIQQQKIGFAAYEKWRAERKDRDIATINQLRANEQAG